VLIDRDDSAMAGPGGSAFGPPRAAAPRASIESPGRRAYDEPMESITAIDEGSRPKAIGTIVSAFAADPVERWLYPEDAEYGSHFPEFVDAFGGKAFERGTAWGLEGNSAVALWLGPQVEPDADSVAKILSESVAPAKHEELFSVLGQMGEVHPTAPHWYLPWLGVQAGHQGQGLGGVLLRQCLTIVDASGLPAFLETPNPRNIGLYERHGFEVIATTTAPSCPPLTSMLRAARSR
jgi:GNAT superfamily N-acetyltransferase